jgi:MerR family transcriptional regulator, heat shock protein HspR
MPTEIQMPRKKRPEARRYVMISVIAERYGIHPQTLRLYEREGLIVPQRSAGNTRLYDEVAIERLEAILTLTRDLGVNLAGVELVLSLRSEVNRLEGELARLVRQLRSETAARQPEMDRSRALVPLSSRALVKR